MKLYDHQNTLDIINSFEYDDLLNPMRFLLYEICQEVVKINPLLANIFLIRTKYPKRTWDLSNWLYTIHRKPIQVQLIISTQKNQEKGRSGYKK